MSRLKKSLLLSAAVLITTFITAFTAAPATALDAYEIDNAHTSLIFAVSHFNLSYTYGRFNTVSGDFDVTGVQPNRFNFSVEAASIDTNSAERDNHLRSIDFFDVEQFPKITFESTTVQQVGDSYNAIGNLTMLGTTKEVTIPLQLVGMGQGPFGKTRAGYFAKFTLKRSEFGMDKMQNGVGDNIAITFSFEGIKKEPGDETFDGTPAVETPAVPGIEPPALPATGETEPFGSDG